ncbi:hypothetical protein OESDEN_13516 [Oesophagostomum dentatum]|uniref:Uncharacterized protein n=1 Tax=Oesophagostomum dentatum TaxID=61180 RepID=A0A0B1SU73_OESDE|nr:hypothetical protein OESDEN_13516 [Oesophagostomum dentatum]
MVPTTLFSSFGEEDYNQEDSGDDSDSEEQSEPPVKEEPPPAEEPKETKKDEQADLTATLQQTLKEALKAAGTNRLMQQKRRQASPPQPPPSSQSTQAANANAFLAPFLLSGLTANTSTNGTIFQLPQGCVYTSSPNSTEGGASANSLLINSTKGDDAASNANPLLSFPFQFNFQQLMESAALGAQITNTSE